MFLPLKNFAKSYEIYMTKLGRGQVVRVLMTQDDRTLEDMGISRHLLLQGVDAWPWREGEVAVVPQRASKLANSRKEKRAIHELRAMTNAELNDIGISRSGIVDAVRYGRTNQSSGQESSQEINVPRRLLNEQPRKNKVVVAPKRMSKLAKSRQEKRAIRELRAMSNAELSDIGISRSGIVDAIRYGRTSEDFGQEAYASRRIVNVQTTPAAKAVVVEDQAQPEQALKNVAA